MFKNKKINTEKINFFFVIQCDQKDCANEVKGSHSLIEKKIHRIIKIYKSKTLLFFNYQTN